MKRHKEEYNAILRQQLKKFRDEYQYEQKDVAKYLNITRSAYANYENSDRLPDIFAMDKLARLYNVSIEAFLYPPSLYNTFKENHQLSYDQNKIPDIELSPVERKLLYHFRALNEAEQKEIIFLTEYKDKHKYNKE